MPDTNAPTPEEEVQDPKETSAEASEESTEDLTAKGAAIGQMLRSKSLWVKLSGIAGLLFALMQFYYDVRDDIRDALLQAKEAQEEVEQTEDALKKTGRQSEESTAGAISELQEKMKFVYQEGTLMQDRIADLEFENKRLTARLDRYREVSGIPPEELGDDALRDLASRLLPFLHVEGSEEGTSDTVTTVTSDFDPGEDSSSPPEDAVPADIVEQRAKFAPGGQLKFDKMPAKAW